VARRRRGAGDCGEPAREFEALALFSVGGHAPTTARPLPPTLLLSGGEHDAVPVEDTRLLYQEVKSAGGTAKLFVYPNGNAPVARAAGNCGNRPRGGLPTPLPRLARDRLPRDRRPEKREVRVDRERASEPRLRRRAPETALDHRAVEDEERVARPQPERPDRVCPRSGAVAGAEEPPRDRILGVDAGPGGVGRAGARQGVGHVPVVVEVEKGRLELGAHAVCLEEALDRVDERVLAPRPGLLAGDVENVAEH